MQWHGNLYQRQNLAYQFNTRQYIKFLKGHLSTVLTIHLQCDFKFGWHHLLLYISGFDQIIELPDSNQMATAITMKCSLTFHKHKKGSEL